MPISPRRSEPLAFEERISRVMDIIDKIHNPFEKQLLRNFIFELCQRYINVSKQLELFGASEERDSDVKFIEVVLRDLNIDNGL
jgi:hypothetical protein